MSGDRHKKIRPQLLLLQKQLDSCNIIIDDSLMKRKCNAFVIGEHRNNCLVFISSVFVITVMSTIYMVQSHVVSVELVWQLMQLRLSMSHCFVADLGMDRFIPV